MSPDWIPLTSNTPPLVPTSGLSSLGPRIGDLVSTLGPSADDGSKPVVCFRRLRA